MTFEKVLVVLVIAAVIVGPHRLPALAHRLAEWVRAARSMIEATRARVELEVGAPLAVDEWRSLDPRQYDPRRIVREALAAPAAVSAGATDADGRNPQEFDPAVPVVAPDPDPVRASGPVVDAVVPDAADRERANRIAALSPGGWRPARGDAESAAA